MPAATEPQAPAAFEIPADLNAARDFVAALPYDQMAALNRFAGYLGQCVNERWTAGE